MSGWTIAQISGFPSCLIEQPVEGEVKLAMEVKQNDKGPSQFFVLKDGTGEIGVSYYAADKDGAGFAAVKVGDKIRIQATQGGKGKLAGASKGQYDKDGKTHPKLTVYGNRLTNLTRHTQAPAAGVQTPPAASSAAGPALPPIPEQEAVESYWRIFERCAAKLSRYMAVEDFEGFMAAADLRELDSCHAATREVFRGLLSGRVAPSHQQPAPASKPASRTTTPTDDPFEGIADDDDIPF